MAISPYLRGLRQKVGNSLIVVPAAVALLFDEEGRLLIALDADTRLWMAVGGAIDPDETPAQAAVRECYEETGLVVEPTRLAGVFGGPEFRTVYPNGDEVSFVTTTFEVRQIAGVLRPDGLEVSELRFVTQSELAALSTSPLNRALFEHAFSPHHWPYFSKRSPESEALDEGPAQILAVRTRA